MAPPPPSTMSGIACFIIRNGPLRLTRMTSSKFSSESSVSGRTMPSISAVEQGVQAAVGLAHFSHQAGDTAGIGHVEPDGPAALSEQRSGLLGAVKVGAEDAGALLRQLSGDGGARAEPAPVTMAT